MHGSKTKLVSGSRGSLRDHRSRVQGKANTMSPGDTDSSHGTEVRAKIKDSSKGALLFSEEKEEVTSGQTKNSSSHRPISAQLRPVLPSKEDGGAGPQESKEKPNQERCLSYLTLPQASNTRTTEPQHPEIQLVLQKATFFKGLCQSGS